MRAVVLHSAVDPSAPPDEQDVLIQARFVASALARLGWEAHILPFHLNLEALRDRLQAVSPDVVFNLVETAAGTGRLIHVAPAILDVLGIPYTGSPTEAVFLTSHKVLAKRLMSSHALPTPPALTSPEDWDLWEPEALYIVKSVWEDASVGITQDSVATFADPGDLEAALDRGSRATGGGDVFAERFIDGREFNLSLLAGPDGPRVLPPAEIRFRGFGPDRFAIVDYEAKWDPSSFAYQNTVRSFDFREEDRFLLHQLKELALRCWDLFGLRGYARVDFRVDAAGRPWILEVNANPCLSPDAGFMAAAAEAALEPEQVILRILEDAVRP
ncbi:D-alanine-D-alanine ligase [Desulfacinum infernum DSM 9756]|uniref:D-alanine-D-alanine ligase n=1 Tax=Desulfacinum infernum DSM 9756 TaxID=1121391 RepID=A0A1M4YIU3_9BACT|nr:hypothetical protein [Desulfacinum infernum]SHF05774.1 D-alanine-D-alanine ligase [Desulfacinum infernum DSM 9756]